MDVSIQQELDSILGGIEVKSEKKLKHKQDNELFSRNFHKLRGDVIRPVMEEISKYLAKKSLLTEIIVTDDSESENASITFMFTLDFKGVDEMKYHFCPYLKISYRAQEFCLTVLTGQIGGKYSYTYSDERNEPYRINDFNSEAIQRKILDIFKIAC